MLVGDVICQLEFVKIDDFWHPLFTSSWTVRVNVHPLWHFGVCLPRHHPAGVVKLISAVVSCNYIHQENVFGLLVQTSAPHFERGKHPPVTRGNRSGSAEHSREKPHIFQKISKMRVWIFAKPTHQRYHISVSMTCRKEETLLLFEFRQTSLKKSSDVVFELKRFERRTHRQSSHLCIVCCHWDED